jgi:hypothetical protein
MLSKYRWKYEYYNIVEEVAAKTCWLFLPAS